MIPTTLTSIMSVAGWVIAGALGLAGVFNMQRQQRRRDDDQTASNLITNLKTTADLQDKELVSLRTKEVEQGKEIAHLQGQIKVLTDILQGRDPKTLATLEQIPLIYTAAMKNGESIEKLTRAMADFMASFQKALEAKQV